MQGLGGVTSVKSLTAVMYRDMKGWGGAYKLLNATGRIGSQGKHEHPQAKPLAAAAYMAL